MTHRLCGKITTGKLSIQLPTDGRFKPPSLTLSGQAECPLKHPNICLRLEITL